MYFEHLFHRRILKKKEKKRVGWGVLVTNLRKNKINPNHDSRKLKFDIFENFTNNGESIRLKWRVTRIEKKYPIPITDHGHGHGEKMVRFSRERKMNAMRGSKDLYSRILGGIRMGSEGQTQLQYFKGRCPSNGYAIFGNKGRSLIR